MDVSRRKLLGMLAGMLGIGAIAGACSREPQAAPSTPASSTSTTTTLRPASTASVASTTSPTTAPGPTPTVPLPESLQVIGREGWSDRPQGQFREHRIERITIHHTASYMVDNSRAPRLLRQHEDWHMSHGWPDLAYHFMVDRNGNVYEGRPIDAIGDTFTEYDPTGHFLACFEGDFDRQDPSTPQLAAMTTLVAWAMQTYRVPGSAVTGHRDWASTTCPGRRMQWRLPGLVRAADDHREIALTYLTGEEARSRVAAIAAGE